MNDEVKTTEIVGESATEYAVVDMPGAGVLADGLGDAVGTGSLADELPEGVQFDMLASGGASTVCATVPFIERESTSYQSEAQLEDAFIAQLQRQAYEYLPLTSEADLVANVRTCLEQLNGINFTDGEWKHFFSTCVASENDGIAEKTRRIQEDHIQTFQRDDGSTVNIRLIDKRNIHNNKLQVINQYVAQGGARENRYDVTILVNGLPLVHVELKRRGVAIKEAFYQIERYKRDSFWAGSGLYEYVQVFVISNGTHTKYYSNTTREAHIKERENRNGNAKKTSNSFEFTSWWADAENKPIQDLMLFTKTFFAKHTLLNILTKYCIYTEEGLLLVIRP